MSDCNCPVKEAARDAPHLIAIQSQDISLTFSEWDHLIDTCQETTLPPSGIPFLITFFSLLRRGLSPVLCNPKDPSHKVTPIPPKTIGVFTSGSSGKPKLALLSLNQFCKSASLALPFLNFAPNDRWLLSLPLYHVGGLGIVFRAILGRGIISLSSQDPKITHLSNVPTQLYRAWPIYPRLKCLLVGGAPPNEPPERLPILTTYGLTEMASMVTLQKKLLPGREVRIAPDKEILVRGEVLFEGYWEEGRLKSPFDKEGWFPTKDLGKLEKGLLSILGRKDRMFISGGENIHPEEIEKALLEIPDVLEAHVKPLSDPEFGMRPIAFLHTTDKNFTLKKMEKILLEKLPKFKLPIQLILLDEFPKKGLKIDSKNSIFSLPKILKCS